jgi:hypothetical protein
LELSFNIGHVQTWKNQLGIAGLLCTLPGGSRGSASGVAITKFVSLSEHAGDVCGFWKETSFSRDAAGWLVNGKDIPDRWPIPQKRTAGDWPSVSLAAVLAECSVHPLFSVTPTICAMVSSELRPFQSDKLVAAPVLGAARSSRFETGDIRWKLVAPARDLLPSGRKRGDFGSCTEVCWKVWRTFGVPRTFAEGVRDFAGVEVVDMSPFSPTRVEHCESDLSSLSVFLEGRLPERAIAIRCDVADMDINELAGDVGPKSSNPMVAGG